MRDGQDSERLHANGMPKLKQHASETRPMHPVKWTEAPHHALHYGQVVDHLDMRPCREVILDAEEPSRHLRQPEASI